MQHVPYNRSPLHPHRGDPQLKYSKKPSQKDLNNRLRKRLRLQKPRSTNSFRRQYSLYRTTRVNIRYILTLVTSKLTVHYLTDMKTERTDRLNISLALWTTLSGPMMHNTLNEMHSCRQRYCYHLMYHWPRLTSVPSVDLSYGFWICQMTPES